MNNVSFLEKLFAPRLWRMFLKLQEEKVQLLGDLKALAQKCEKHSEDSRLLRHLETVVIGEDVTWSADDPPIVKEAWHLHNRIRNLDARLNGYLKANEHNGKKGWYTRAISGKLRKTHIQVLAPRGNGRVIVENIETRGSTCFDIPIDSIIWEYEGAAPGPEEGGEGQPVEGA